MKCQACQDGVHYLCGMQTWCDCDCDGPDGVWGPSPDDDMPHSDTCTCEHCAQTYPERIPENWNDDLWNDESSEEDLEKDNQ